MGRPAPRCRNNQISCFRVAEADRSSERIVERKSIAAALPVPDQVAGCSLSRPVSVFVLVVMLFLALRI